MRWMEHQKCLFKKVKLLPRSANRETWSCDLCTIFQSTMMWWWWYNLVSGILRHSTQQQGAPCNPALKPCFISFDLQEVGGSMAHLRWRCWVLICKLATALASAEPLAATWCCSGWITQVPVCADQQLINDSFDSDPINQWSINLQIYFPYFLLVVFSVGPCWLLSVITGNRDPDFYFIKTQI